MGRSIQVPTPTHDLIPTPSSAQTLADASRSPPADALVLARRLPSVPRLPPPHFSSLPASPRFCALSAGNGRQGAGGPITAAGPRLTRAAAGSSGEAERMRVALSELPTTVSNAVAVLPVAAADGKARRHVQGGGGARGREQVRVHFAARLREGGQLRRGLPTLRILP